MNVDIVVENDELSTSSQLWKTLHLVIIKEKNKSVLAKVVPMEFTVRRQFSGMNDWT